MAFDVILCLNHFRLPIMKKCFFVTITKMLFLTNTYAQEIPLMENVNITNSRSIQKNSTTGKNIAIIEGKWFNMLPVLSMDDLLKYTSGIEIQQRGPAGSQADIIIRGGTFQQVLVLIDGMKWNDAITGHFSGYLPITPSEIERIEIIKGPASAMYGSEAVGGVINIISKTFNRKKNQKSQSKNASLSIGEYGLLGMTIGVNEEKEKIKFGIGSVYNIADGQMLRPNNRGYFNNQTSSGSISFLISPSWRFSLHSAYDARSFAAQNFYTTLLSDTATEKVSSWWNHLQLQQSKGKNTNQINITYKKTSDQYTFNPVSVANKNNSSNLQLQFIRNHKSSERFNYLFGALAEQKEIQSNDRGNHINRHAAIFTSSSIQLKQFNINPGIRLVHDENYRLEWLPQLNASYTFSHFVFRGGIGKAIRAADFTERFNNYNKIYVKGGSIGNPDLTAEQSWSYELGTDFTTPILSASLTGFVRDQKNLIDFVNSTFFDIPRNLNLDSNGKYAYAKNVKSITTKGVEFDLSIQKKFSTKLQLISKTSLLVLDSKTSDSIPSYYILSHARLLAQEIIVIRYQKIEFAVTGIYKERNAQTAPAISAENTPSYFLCNIKIQYHGKGLTTFVNINNLNDTKYSDLLGSRMPGRWLSGGLSLFF
jgi:vitamin B12 transporter